MKAKAIQAISSKADEMITEDLKVHVATLKVVLGDHLVVEGSRKAKSSWEGVLNGQSRLYEWG